MMLRALLLLVLGTGSASAQTVWRAVTEYPATAMPGEGLTGFAARVAERSAGRIVVQPGFDAPDGLRSATIPAAVQAGRIAVGDSFAGALAGIDPVFQLSSLPFLATTDGQARRLYDTARPDYVRVFASMGQRLLYSTPWPATGLWSRDAVPDAAALHGLRVRTYDATSTSVIRRAGAAPTELSFADAMPYLRDGRVVAVLSSGDGGAGRKLWDYTRHFTAIGYAMPLSFATVSTAAYEALSPELRQAVDAAAADTEAAQWTALVTRTEKNYATMRANGVEIAPPSPDLAAALARAGEAIVAEWTQAAGAAASVLTAYRAK